MRIFEACDMEQSALSRRLLSIQDWLLTFRTAAGVITHCRFELNGSVMAKRPVANASSKAMSGRTFMKLSLFLCIAMVEIIVVGTEARAGAARDYEVDYYAEPQLRTQVGMFYKPCGTGAATMNGQRTRYFTKSQSSCLIVGGIGGQTLSCHFTQAGCTDALAHAFPIIPHAPGFSPSAGGTSSFQLSAADRELYKKNQRDSGIKGK
jgi:hypothetical protein